MRTPPGCGVRTRRSPSRHPLLAKARAPRSSRGSARGGLNSSASPRPRPRPARPSPPRGRQEPAKLRPRLRPGPAGGRRQIPGGPHGGAPGRSLCPGTAAGGSPVLRAAGWAAGGPGLRGAAAGSRLRNSRRFKAGWKHARDRDMVQSRPGSWLSNNLHCA